MFVKAISILVVSIVVMFATMVGASQAEASTWGWNWSKASAYGPGLWGNNTGCRNPATGRPYVLTRSTLGVAHKTLPCNAKLRVCYKGKCQRLKVIDRGPFVAGRDLDLTHATVRRFGFRDCYHWGVKTVKWKRRWYG